MAASDNAKEAPKLIFETVHGSTAYNLAREGSDVDLKGIVVGPRRWYFGIETPPEQLNVSPDHVRYEVRKLMVTLPPPTYLRTSMSCC
jgi:predicted nucleotidyltransferase